MPDLQTLSPLRIVYFGSAGDLSTLPLKGLINSPHIIVAIALHEPELKHTRLNVVGAGQQNDVQSIAFQNNITIIRLSGGLDTIKESVFDCLQQSSLDLIVTSCFSQKIPGNIIALARLGAINIHPSLLPAYRGPDPIFWQIRDAVIVSGVTLHLMNDQFDAGNIVAQQKVKLDGSFELGSLNSVLAHIAKELLIETLSHIKLSIEQAWEQDEASSSYHFRPNITSFELSTDWDAKTLFDFVKATKGRTLYYPISIKGKGVKLVDVNACHDTKQENLTVTDKYSYFACKSGFIAAEILTD